MDKFKLFFRLFNSEFMIFIDKVNLELIKKVFLGLIIDWRVIWICFYVNYYCGFVVNVVNIFVWREEENKRNKDRRGWLGKVVECLLLFFVFL